MSAPNPSDRLEPSGGDIADDTDEETGTDEQRQVVDPDTGQPAVDEPETTRGRRRAPSGAPADSGVDGGRPGAGQSADDDSGGSGQPVTDTASGRIAGAPDAGDESSTGGGPTQAGGSEIPGAPGTSTDPTDNPPATGPTTSSDGVRATLARRFPFASVAGAQATDAAQDAASQPAKQTAGKAAVRRFPALSAVAGDFADDQQVATPDKDRAVPQPDIDTAGEQGRTFTDRQRGRQTGSVEEAKFLDMAFGGFDDTARSVESDVFSQETGTEEQFLRRATDDTSPGEAATSLAPFAAAEPTPTGEAAMLGLIAAGALGFADERSDPFTRGKAPARKSEVPVEPPQSRRSEVSVDENGARQPELPAEEPGVTELGIPDDGMFVETVEPSEPDATIQLRQQGKQRQRDRRKVKRDDIAKRKQVERRRSIGEVKRRRDTKKEREQRKRQQRRRKREAESPNVQIDDDAPPRVRRTFPTGRGAVVGLDGEAQQAQEPEVTREGGLLDGTTLLEESLLGGGRELPDVLSLGDERLDQPTDIDQLGDSDQQSDTDQRQRDRTDVTPDTDLTFPPVQYPQPDVDLPAGTTDQPVTTTPTIPETTTPTEPAEPTATPPEYGTPEEFRTPTVPGVGTPVYPPPGRPDFTFSPSERRQDYRPTTTSFESDVFPSGILSVEEAQRRRRTDEEELLEGEQQDDEDRSRDGFIL